MPLNADARRVLDLMAEAGAPPLDSQLPADARATRTAVIPPILDPCHEMRDLDAGGVPARLYLPEPSDGPTGLLVWFHGGGWVMGSIDGHDNVCSSLASRSGHAVLSVDYRLAPEAPFPAALDDCIAATVWAAANAAELGIDPTRIAVGGDSAGGNIAAVVANEAVVPLALQLLVYPVTDCNMSTRSYVDNAEGYLLTASSMRWFTDHYLSGDEGTADDPRVSPLLAADNVLSAAPPAFVVTAGFDPLCDEGVAYADRLATLGVSTNHLHYPGEIHAFFSLPHLVADARSAHAAAAQALADAFA
jgi:acetyl esterase